ncbi:hypothetical protein [Granulicella arctica]|uniref:hypothetical protein n=1 Tax=Granulicella arctica TaxID=940613 RepID=UPI0021E0751C|nr:hypothetical protein [Granulicella arctica]
MSLSGPTTNHNEIRIWAESHQIVPTELLPHVLDHEPAELRMMLAGQANGHPDIKVLTWEEFFLKFDSLGLTFVYDDERAGYNEILQIEEKSPYRPPKYRPAHVKH